MKTKDSWISLRKNIVVIVAIAARVAAFWREIGLKRVELSSMVLNNLTIRDHTTDGKSREVNRISIGTKMMSTKLPGD